MAALSAHCSARYKVVSRLGEGAFSEVHLASDGVTGRTVALKRVFLKDTRGGRFPVLAFRELQGHRALAGCGHVVPVLGHYIDRGCLVLVLPSYPCDLATLLDHVAGEERCSAGAAAGSAATRGSGGGASLPPPRAALSLTAVRSLLRDVLAGLAALHARGLMHRDVKPANVLLDAEGRAHVGDLGLIRPFARTSDSDGRETPLVGMAYTAQVSSRWYRAPEVLLGDSGYGPAIDVWAVGAIAVELLTGSPLAPGGSDIEQLSRTWAARGTPTAESWPSVAELPDWGKLEFMPRAPPPLQQLLQGRPSCDHAAAFFEGALCVDPCRRWTTEQALECTWLAGGGCACTPVAPRLSVRARAAAVNSASSLLSVDGRGAREGGLESGAELKGLVAEAAVAASKRVNKPGSPFSGDW